jgi:hypothetical protein
VVIADARGDKSGLLHVIDESGIGHVYPMESYMAPTLPPSVGPSVAKVGPKSAYVDLRILMIRSAGDGGRLLRHILFAVGMPNKH